MPEELARQTLARLARYLNRRSRVSLPALALVTDDERLPTPLAAIAALPRGSLVVLRARKAARRAVLAEKIAPLVGERALKLVVANDAELASRLRADGLHLSEARMHDAAHWRALRPAWTITVAAHSLTACLAAGRCGADAAFFGPVFATQSHRDRAGLGLVRALAIAAQSPLPLYALGGIDAQAAMQLRDSRFAGLAAIGALRV